MSMAEIPKGYVLQPDGSYSHPSRVGIARVDPGQRTEPAGPLVEAPRTRKGRARRLGKLWRGPRADPVVVVTMLSCRRRLLDDDNLAAGFKPLRDAISETLGIDDADPRVKWEPRQIESKREETIVRIAIL